MVKFLFFERFFHWLYLQLNCCGGSSSAMTQELCADAPEGTQVNLPPTVPLLYHCCTTYCTTAVPLLYHMGAAQHQYTTRMCSSQYVLCFMCPQDCLTAIIDFFNEKLHIIGYIGIGIAGVVVRNCNILTFSYIFSSFSLKLLIKLAGNTLF